MLRGVASLVLVIDVACSAAGHCAGHRVVVGIMTSDGSDDGTADAAFSRHWRRSKQST